MCGFSKKINDRAKILEERAKGKRCKTKNLGFIMAVF